MCTLVEALRETCPRGLCVGRPAGTSFCDIHAPAASLGRRQAPPLGGGLAATVSPQAQIQRCGQPFRRSLGLAPCPTHRGAPRAAHALPPRPAADRFALLRGLRLGRSAIAAQRRGFRRAPPPDAPPPAPRVARGGSAPPCVRRRAGRVRPCSRPAPALRGRGVGPAPLPTCPPPAGKPHPRTVLKLY